MHRRISDGLPSHVVHIHFNLPLPFMIADRPVGDAASPDFRQPHRRGCVCDAGAISQKGTVQGQHRLASPNPGEGETGFAVAGSPRGIEKAGVESCRRAFSVQFQFCTRWESRSWETTGPVWLSTDRVLAQFGGRRQEAQGRYRRFV